MRRWVSPRVFLPGLFAIAPSLVGCDSDAFAPAPPSGLKTSSTTSPTAPVRAREIVLILPTEENVDTLNYENICRLEAGTLKVSYRAYKPKPGDPPTRQAQLIADAASQGASALVVVPEKTKEAAEALAAVDQKKTPIVLLGRPVDSPKGLPGSTLVTFPPFAGPAKKVVAAIVEDMKKQGLSPDAPVLFFKDETPDETAAERHAALLDALKEAKLTVAETVTLVDQPNESRKRLDEAIKAHPKIAAVIADSETATLNAGSARAELTPRGTFLIAGFVNGANSMGMVDGGQASALADRKIDTLARRAIRLALDRADGKAVPDRVEVEVNYKRARNLRPAFSK